MPDLIVTTLMLVVFFGVPILLAIDLRRPLKFTARRCHNCNFDRRNIAADSKCPECGTPPGIQGMGRPPDDRFPSCRSCGHLLENLPWDTACPECGLACAALPNFQRIPRSRLSSLRGLYRVVMGGLWGLSSLYLLIALAAMI